MKFKNVNQDYIDQLKTNDEVYVLVHPWPTSLNPNGDRVRKGKFVRKTPTGKLSIELADGKMWLNSNGQRTQTNSPYSYIDFSLVYFPLVRKVENEGERK